MRYYDFMINEGSESLKTNAKINIKDFSWDGVIPAMNSYMLKNLKNGMNFFVYRDEDNAVCAAFSYDDKTGSFKEAYEHVLEKLDEAFPIQKNVSDPEEITMYQFLDRLSEGRRRDYICNTGRVVDASHLWIYSYYINNAEESLHYEFNEKMIRQETSADAIYDKSFVKELSNIEAHKNTDDHNGNLVHYVISCRSVEAAGDMTGRLMQSLLASKRISSGRMEIISDIDPDVYRHNNHLEEIIENNYGGVIIFDLTEKFGRDPVDYQTTSRYILEKLVKRYRNHCLFVFTYNMDHPGFSYQVLPKLEKYVIPVMLREGRGNRKAAVNYMKSLIKRSEYAQYADQAAEYMKQYPGNDFSQTDVISAFDRFESWCINKNILKAYDHAPSDGFMLDRDESGESAYDRLNKLVGLELVKKQIESIIAADVVDKERKKRKGKDYQSGSRHMIFAGNPGSAKTTVAKLFAGIAKEKGILKSGAFVERGGMDLDGLGCVTRIREAFTAANGGVLFIDEAYSLKGDTAVTVLIQEMENRRDDVIVIFAGYGQRMKDFLELNEGLKSRLPHWIDFPDYTADELTEIFRFMTSRRGFAVTEDVVKEARYIFEKVIHTDDFGNGRYVRNLIDRAVQNQAVRLLSDGRDAGSIGKSELFKLKKEDICMLDEGMKKERPAGTALRELNEMTGLKSVKEIIRKATASCKLRKLCIDKGINRGKASMHMVFTGNPGTAKTTVARLFAEIMKDEKVLPTGNFVETGRADLIGDHVGATAPKVKRRFKEAQGGVLFIDEAYSLCDAYSNGFGDEAINTLVQEMENHRDDVIVIFAGYPEPMKQFLDRNPGMLSRIAFQVEFDDYSVDELCDITRLMVDKKEMRITDAAMDKLRGIYEEASLEDDYGNGRFARKMLEEAEMNLAERVMETDGEEITEEMITTIKECDIPAYNAKKQTKLARIGFAC
ncbi:MAG: AAA family ATPase [Lachnospiraceae bacterium]|nr:AAA family ATPase [Lachnospiraceae bacterium]